MKVIVEFNIKASKNNPRVKPDPEQVTRLIKQRLINHELSVLWLEYEDPKTKKQVRMVANLKRCMAVEPL